ncbi:membrane fusion component of tripartite multidrug resistance system [Photobacterium aphoticum]|uniref:Membrane fusion component of tripartite multidrug resistance system n=1 Tax=Photobacterium aphoticum TaxID=754436 RepID=A0A090RBR6_9GAMM|nr:membrane fusion component of tripartite multidrug resistance system [Photobacterium aphoticum]
MITADNVSPFTTQATMHRAVANIAPEVSGVVTSVNVKNGENVHKGDVLFTIDSDAYQLAVRQAQAELQQAKEAFAAKRQELNAAEQTFAQRQLEASNAEQKLTRYTALRRKGLSTQQELDDIKLSAVWQNVRYTLRRQTCNACKRNWPMKTPMRRLLWQKQNSTPQS